MDAAAVWSELGSLRSRVEELEKVVFKNQPPVAGLRKKLFLTKDKAPSNRYRFDYSEPETENGG